MTEAEREEAIDVVAYDLQAGDVLQATGGCRKICIAGRGNGKRGVTG
jgi:hypothetical protein